MTPATEALEHIRAMIRQYGPNDSPATLYAALRYFDYLAEAALAAQADADFNQQVERDLAE